MGKMTIPAMVEGGKATAGPPLGPALGAAKVNIQGVLAQINEKTAAFKGMQVPIKVIIDSDTKGFEVVVGTPPVSALLKKELGISENVKEESGAKGKRIIGNITVPQIVKIAGMKKDAMLSRSLKAQVKEIVGTCKSMGITVEGKDPREVTKEITEGKFDSVIRAD
ncbi:MAG TPA: 50S ribosomal protein L11 [Candidatus Norongarragalinales archaeon]|nr:50S ribosomal protein L11 [Candidatus Norongarragalinales archaeon]